jgi:hypothetical protein
MENGKSLALKRMFPGITFIRSLSRVREEIDRLEAVVYILNGHYPELAKRFDRPWSPVTEWSIFLI